MSPITTASDPEWPWRSVHLPQTFQSSVIENIHALDRKNLHIDRNADVAYNLNCCIEIQIFNFRGHRQSLRPL